ncbi:MAG: hypothetical protein U0525_00020 [Patescibacteria group bacterium]
MSQTKTQPLPKVENTKIESNKGVENPNRFSYSHKHLFGALLSSLLIPGLLILDFVLFNVTRPSCAACASFSGYFADHSMTIAFIQGNKAIQNVLVIFRKKV